MGQTRKLKPMGTHKASYYELLPALRWGSLGPPPGPEDHEDSSGVPMPVTARAQEPSATGAVHSGLGSLAPPRERGPAGQVSTVTRWHVISRRRWAVSWWQATVSRSDKQHSNPIVD